VAFTPPPIKGAGERGADAAPPDTAPTPEVAHVSPERRDAIRIWRLDRPTVALEIVEAGVTPSYSRRGLHIRSLEIDRQLRAEPWPEGVAYVSLVNGLCGSEGCRRRFGDNLPISPRSTTVICR